jgi:hypothetical protein
MPNKVWSDLNNLQLGQYAEYYSKMEFASYGFDVYTSEVDDHGIDFIVKTMSGRFLEIQVKSVRNYNYVFIRKDKWNKHDPNLFLSLLLFEENILPKIYLIPANAWKNPNAMFKDKDYKGLKSKPEYGLNLSKRNIPLLDKYAMNNVVNRIK